MDTHQAKMGRRIKGKLSAIPTMGRGNLDGIHHGPARIGVCNQAGDDDDHYVSALRIVSDELWDRVKDRQDAAAKCAAGLAGRRKQGS